MTLHWAALAAAIVLTALAQVTYKLYFRAHRRALVLLSVGLFLSASLMAYLALKGLSIGMVYMSTAITQILMAGLSRFILKETFSRDHAVAMTMIVTGIVIYAV
ncbi:MAG: hypothetical protein ACE5FN_03305 [Leptospirillia bacterium]